MVVVLAVSGASLSPESRTWLTTMEGRVRESRRLDFLGLCSCVHRHLISLLLILNLCS